MSEFYGAERLDSLEDAVGCTFVNSKRLSDSGIVVLFFRNEEGKAFYFASFPNYSEDLSTNEMFDAGIISMEDCVQRLKLEDEVRQELARNNNYQRLKMLVREYPEKAKELLNEL